MHYYFPHTINFTFITQLRFYFENLDLFLKCYYNPDVYGFVIYSTEAKNVQLPPSSTVKMYKNRDTLLH